MGGDALPNISIRCVRALAFALVTCTALWVAASRGVWYDSHVFARKSTAFEFWVGDLHASGLKARVLMFFTLPIIIASFLGASWEALWIGAQLHTSRRFTRNGRETAATVVNGGHPYIAKSPSYLQRFRSWRKLVNFTFRPLGPGSPWITLSGAAALTFYVVVMLTMIWQGVRFKMEAYNRTTMPCTDNPSLRCYDASDELAVSIGLARLKNVAKYMGFAAAASFSLVLLPASRENNILSAFGVPLERAALIHTTLGHLVFVTLFLHGGLYMWYYGLKHGWKYALRSVYHFKGHGVNVPAGVAAGVCAGVVWVMSTVFVRRRYYRLFKTTHFLSLGVLVGGIVHYNGFIFYLLAGASVYLAHAASRIDNFKWWSSMCKGCSASNRHGPLLCNGSLEHLHVGEEYTRLVLRIPRNGVMARGGMLVYLSAPALLGSGEAHPISVALRGSPPCLWNRNGGGTLKESNSHEEEVFTVYVKAVGVWTRALHKQRNSNLLVRVDGFYGGTTTLMSMSKGGRARVVMFAGGSGVTSFLALAQDWCRAHAHGERVPEVHLVWSCRRLSEIELLGEALPSLIASAGPGADDRFNISLFCSGQVEGYGPLSVTWSALEIPRRVGHYRGITPESVFHALNSGIRTFVAAGGAVAGWFLAENMAEGAVLKGLLTAALVVCIPLCLLPVYEWASTVAFRSWSRKTALSSVSPSQRYMPLGQMTASGDVEDRTNSPSSTKKSYPVNVGRIPVRALLLEEQAFARREGLDRIKVLVSGPTKMADFVFADAATVDSGMFNVEALSRDF